MPNSKKIENKKIQNQELKKARNKIDEIDRNILQQINLRAFYAEKIGKIKRQKDELIYQPEREKKVIENLEKILTHDPTSHLPIPTIKFIYSEIMSACRSLQYLQNPIIGYLGPKGSFSHLAGLRKFGHSTTLKPFENFETIFKMIDKGEIYYGIIPIENSINGMINEAIDLFTQFEISISGEIFLNIHLNLFSKEKSLHQIEKIYSHALPFAQSKNWIKKHLPKAKLISVNSTSEGAQKILNQKNAACIASEQMTSLYPHLNLLYKNIEDRTDNTTRFVIIEKKELTNQNTSSNPKNITSLIITIKDKPGALYQILSILAKEKVNLTNLVSRPSHKKAFDYLFYIDFIGDPEEKRIKKVLKGMTPYVVSYKIIGTYCRGFTYH